MVSHASLAKRPRLSYNASPLGLAMESFTAEEELARQRFLSQSRLRLSWEGIFAKYSKNFEGIADEIDQVTGEIVVDNGHVRGMPVSIAGEGPPKAAKKSLSCDAVVKRDVDGDASALVEVGCEACRFQDELDDSICSSCSLQGSSLLATPATAVAGAVANLTLNRLASRTRSSSTMTESPLRNSRRVSSVDEPMVGTPRSQVKDIPSDAFIFKKPGNHGAAVVGLLAKTRAQTVMSSPVPVFSQDDTPSKNRTDYIQGGRTEVEMSPHRAKSPFFATAPPPAMGTLASQLKPLKSSKISADQADIRTWSSTRVATWMLTEKVLHDIEDLDLVHTIKEHHVSGDVIASSTVDGITFEDLSDKLGILSFSKRMTLWSAILKLRTLALSPPRRSQRQITSPTLNSMSVDSATRTKEVNLWAPPPVQEDPFYSHIWGDEHPDGTPLKFLPRTAGPMFFKSEAPASDVAVSGGEGVNKGVKRKRESLAGNTSVLVKVEAVEGSRSAKKSAVGALARSVSKSPKVVKTSDVKTSRPKTPAAKTPGARSSVVKTPTTKVPAGTPVIKTPTTNTTTAKTPITKAPTTGTRTTMMKTPDTKTSIIGTPANSRSAIKTPTTTRVTMATKTPVGTLKTPAATKEEGLTPGWTTNSTSPKKIGRSFLPLVSDGLPNSGLASMWSAKSVMSTRVTVKDESSDDNNDNDDDYGDGDDDDDDDDDGNYTNTVAVAKKDSGSGSGAGMDRKDHVCTGSFCFVCVSLDAEEDDLV
ncbi:hypothetical protein Q9L58_007879 [Maublancomyces gigas]|uniref:SAM domain-containing protein n=1 Tax=Discina gigas TaxID=1032678 RepID=A0ABR3GB79_9PEZI